MIIYIFIISINMDRNGDIQAVRSAQKASLNWTEILIIDNYPNDKLETTSPIDDLPILNEMEEVD
jgi:hypothetical protein